MVTEEHDPGKDENPEAKKPTKIIDLLPKQDEVLDDEELLLKVQDSEGRLKLDTRLPADYELEVQASMLLEHLSAISMTREQWRAARNQSDRQRETKLFDEMRWHQITAAIIEAEFPKAKALCDELAETKARQTRQSRKALADQAKKEDQAKKKED